MAELFKNIYNDDFFNRFTTSLNQLIPEFNSESFVNHIYDAEWEQRELKQRMRHITNTLEIHLMDNFEENIALIVNLIPFLTKSGFNSDGIEFMFLPDFIEVYGLKHYEKSIEAFEKITQFVSCEFAVRPFIIEHPKRMMNQMLIWSKHQHPMVRRLASEGSRPRLPWGMGIPFLKENPKPILPILENLKGDVSESVRRSVANNLNDISKDNKEVVIDIIKKWKGDTKETDWLVKHASRTLLKNGNEELMKLFGFGSVEKIKILNFKILTPRVKNGDSLKFSFTIENQDDGESKIRLEYGMYYQKANGTLSKKVFKISEKKYLAKSTTQILRKQSFKPITTRRYHLGLHKVSIIINGCEFETKDFELIK